MAIILTETNAFSSRHFSCSPNDDGTVTLVAEASTLGYHSPSRIYDDACDVGVAVRSDKTGKTIRYYLSDQDVCNEDVAGWRFEPIAEDARRIPGAARTKLLIIND